MKKIMQELLCELTPEELLHRGQALSAASEDYVRVEGDKKSAMAGFKEQLEDLRMSIARLSGAIRAKAEARLVECAVEYHSPVQATKRIVRLDTGEFVRDEPMTVLECQSHLFDRDRDVNVADLAERAEAAGATGVVGALLDHMKRTSEVEEAIDGMAAPLRNGELTSLTISSGGESVTIDKAAADRIHKRVSKNKEAAKPQFRQEPENT